MKRNLVSLVRKVRKRSGSMLVTAANPVLQRAEERMVEQSLRRNVPARPPIFIIGSPRSGSTLLYKVMTDAFDVAYFNQLLAHFYRTPLAGSAVEGRLLRKKSVDGYEIDYGNLKGLAAPHECGAFWYRWFPKGPHVFVGEQEINNTAKDEIRRQIDAWSKYTKQPVLFKNLYNSMRIAPLLECFPDALFIVCKRDSLQNALSLLRGRIEHGGDKYAWWSLPPREVGELKKLPYQAQVAAQVYYVERQITEDLCRLGRGRFLTVEYEAFCTDVWGSVRMISTFLEQHGLPAAPALEKVPREFETRIVRGISAVDETAVATAVQHYNELEPNA